MENASCFIMKLVQRAVGCNEHVSRGGSIIKNELQVWSLGTGRANETEGFPKGKICGEITKKMKEAPLGLLCPHEWIREPLEPSFALNVRGAQNLLKSETSTNAFPVCIMVPITLSCY